MLRLATSVMLLGVLAVTPGSSGTNCDAAYAGFVARLSQRDDAMSGAELASVNRKALRIFDACDTGHVTEPDALFRRLEVK